MNDNYSSSYSTRSVGEQGTEDFRAFIAFNGHAVSTLHDIPLTPSDGRSSNEILDEHHRELTLNMVVECPRWTSAKMTISTTEPFTPIHQAVTSKGRLAYVRNVFPHHGYIWNYGLLPQVPFLPGTRAPPLHVCEIGERVASIGDVLRVRVLGILGPRDEGVLTWTLLVVNTADPLAKRLHNLGDVESNCPGIMTATKEWFRLYKLPDNKDENTFDLKDVAHREYARDVVRRAHETWKSLVTFAGPTQLVDLTNVTLRNSSTLVSSQDADKSENFAATELGIGTAPADPDSEALDAPWISRYLPHQPPIQNYIDPPPPLQLAERMPTNRSRDRVSLSSSRLRDLKYKRSRSSRPFCSEASTSSPTPTRISRLAPTQFSDELVRSRGGRVGTLQEYSSLHNYSAWFISLRPTQSVTNAEVQARVSLVGVQSRVRVLCGFCRADQELGKKNLAR
ncbi:Pantothenate kinase [Mycena chlorophos]|uniref:inorganic diphosphatase n=1 Tax=Mycena chlorophos TaxID=658473 RepID=A0A8H6SRE6_MYCCL|nr:Pantothenate kinase [Mycena chlorophos]